MYVVVKGGECVIDNVYVWLVEECCGDIMVVEFSVD